MRELTEIKSRDNEKLKFTRRVRDGKEDGHMFIEGARLCGECLESGLDIEFGLVSNEFDLSGVLGDRTSQRNFPTCAVSEKLFESVADTKSPQGIVLIAKKPRPVSVDDLVGNLGTSLPIIVYLYRINNPNNLGAVIRTAEAAGIAGVIVSENSTDPFSPKSLRASMGSAFRLPIVTGAAVDDAIDSAKKAGVQTAAVDVRGTVSHSEHDWKKKTLLVFGSEADGLTDEIVAMADEKLKIEMNSRVESLNLAVSCGIVLFEARRQLIG